MNDMLKKAAGLISIAFLGILLSGANAFAAGELASGTPTVYKVTIKTLELYNGTGWITVFDGIASVIDIASVSSGESAGNFISGLTIPDGTYTQARVMPWNTFTLSGSVTYNGPTYYTTSATTGSYNGTNDSVATTSASAQAECTLTVDPANITAVTSTFSSPLVVTNGVPDHKLRVSFDVTNAMGLSTYSGTYVLWPKAPTITTAVQ